nr:GNAT family N-acetyltransferase [Corynebacterium mendelii]
MRCGITPGREQFEPERTCTMPQTNHTITHDSDHHRYLLAVDGQQAGVAEYRDLQPRLREFFHTVIDPAHRGKGLSHPLIEAALADAVDSGYRIVPSCSAVEHFISKNPEYADHVAGRP